MLEAKEAVIAAGAALSSAVEINSGLAAIGWRVVGIFPGTWTDSAAITFQVSHDGVTFTDLYDESGTEVSIGAGTHANKAYEAPPELSGWHSIKVRSGITGTPVNQTAKETVILVLANI